MTETTAETFCLEPVRRDGAEPVYCRLRDALKGRIAAAGLGPGARLPSVSKVAEMAGVSLRTADRAFDELIREGICYRRRKQGTYVAEGASAALRARPREQVGVFNLSQFEDPAEHPVSGQVLRGLSHAAHEADVDLLFLNGDLRSLLNHYTGIANLRVRGVLAYTADHQLVGELAALFPDLRFIVVNFQRDGFETLPANVVGVFNEEFGGAYTAAEYLLASGTTHLGILSSQPYGGDINYRLREDGARQAAADRGMPCHELALPASSVIREQVAIARQECERLFAAAPATDGIFAANDAYAVGAAHWCREHLPDRPIRICGYDDCYGLRRPGDGIATVAVDFERLGRKAFEVAVAGDIGGRSIHLFPRLIPA